MLIEGIAFRAKGWMEPLQVASSDLPISRSIPSLGPYVDPDVMRRNLEQRFPSSLASDWRAEHAQPVYVRFKPSRYCDFYYRLRSAEPTAVGRREMLVGCRLKTHRIQWRGAEQPDAGQLASPNENPSYCTRFPSDPRIAALSELCSGDGLQTRLRDLLGQPGLRVVPHESDGSRARMLSYRPGRYALLEVATEDENASARRLIVRVFHTRRHAHHAWSMASALSDTRASSATTVAASQALALDSEACLCVFDAHPGSPLTSLVGGGAVANAVRLSATVLARIHDTPMKPELAALPVRTSSTLLQTCSTLQREVSQIENIDQQAVSVTFERLQRSAPAGDLEPVLLHGDFSSNQILYDGHTACAIDLSGVVGDPRIDAGNFLARLQSHVSPHEFDEARGQFLHRYLAHRPSGVDRQTLHWFEAAALFREAFVPMKKLRAGWAEIAMRRLEMARRILA